MGIVQPGMYFQKVKFYDLGHTPDTLIFPHGLPWQQSQLSCIWYNDGFLYLVLCAF